MDVIYLRHFLTNTLGQWKVTVASAALLQLLLPVASSVSVNTKPLYIFRAAFAIVIVVAVVVFGKYYNIN